MPAITSLWAADLIDRTPLRPDDRVLDVACGTGVVTRLAAERIATGRVVGLDLNPGMLAVAQIAANGHPSNGLRGAPSAFRLKMAISMSSFANSVFNSSRIDRFRLAAEKRTRRERIPKCGAFPVHFLSPSHILRGRPNRLDERRHRVGLGNPRQGLGGLSTRLCAFIMMGRRKHTANSVGPEQAPVRHRFRRAAQQGGCPLQPAPGRCASASSRASSAELATPTI